MGWCSGTRIFDPMVAYITGEESLSDEQKTGLLVELIDTLEGEDWDCIEDSAFCDDPLVSAAMQIAHSAFDA